MAARAELSDLHQQEAGFCESTKLFFVSVFSVGRLVYAPII